MLNLDSPWTLLGIVAAVGFLRAVYTVWHGFPFRALMLELCDSLLIAFALVFLLIKPFVVAAFYIPSGSMEPTLMVHDRVLVNRFIYRLSDPRRQDIIVFKAPPQATPNGERKDFIKRLIGLPGDTVQVVAGDGVYINGSRLKEPYIHREEIPEYNSAPTVVPPGQYFVMGDNRNDSNDSHRWGTLDRKYVLGKAMVIFWPPGRMALAR